MHLDESDLARHNISRKRSTVVVEGNHYFPADSINRKNFRESETRTICHWKGEANYYDIVVGEEVNKGAAWYYPEPKDGSLFGKVLLSNSTLRLVRIVSSRMSKTHPVIVFIPHTPIPYMAEILVSVALNAEKL